jgi:hypothetical protein
MGGVRESAGQVPPFSATRNVNQFGPGVGDPAILEIDRNRHPADNFSRTNSIISGIFAKCSTKQKIFSNFP